MTRDDIIRMAQESGLPVPVFPGSDIDLLMLRAFEHFAALVAAAERQPLTEEQIVQVLGNVRESISSNVFLAFARAIEAAHGIKEKNT